MNKNQAKAKSTTVLIMCDIMCSTIVSSTGHELQWKTELRYLGV